VAAITLPDGRVFVAGVDADGGHCQLYDPTKGLFLGDRKKAVQSLDTAVLLQRWKVLVLGGTWPAWRERLSRPV